MTWSTPIRWGSPSLTFTSSFSPAIFTSCSTDRSLEELGIEVGEVVLYQPRRAFDLWNTRYIVVPFESNRLARNCSIALLRSSLGAFRSIPIAATLWPPQRRSRPRTGPKPTTSG